MTKLLTRLIALACMCSLGGQPDSGQENRSAGVTDPTPVRDYPTAVIRKGTRFADMSRAEVSRVGEEQRNYLQSLKREGKLLGAGPFTDDSEIRGIYVFDTSSPEEAAALCRDSPAAKAGRVACEMHMWRVPPRMTRK